MMKRHSQNAHYFHISYLTQGVAYALGYWRSLQDDSKSKGNHPARDLRRLDFSLQSFQV